MPDTFGERLKLHRLLKKMSRSELGKQFGLAETTIANYERGEREPNISLLIAFAEFFNLTTDYLLGKVGLVDSAKLLSMIDLTDAEILSKCTLMLDGRPLNDEEAKWFISMVRSHRNLVDPKG
jgi:transcriptional regulator with XRE-family HTH domain